MRSGNPYLGISTGNHVCSKNIQNVDMSKHVAAQCELLTRVHGDIVTLRSLRWDTAF